VELEERLHHEQVDAAALEDARLLGEELGRVEPAQLDVPERADRAGDEHVAARHLPRLARDAHRGGVDRLRLLREEVAPELGPVRAERVRLDQLGAGADEAEMHLEHALGRAEVRLLRAAEAGDGAREERAHAAVRDDRRVAPEALQATAQASACTVRSSIPPAAVTSSAVTCPESSTEAR